MNWLTIIGPVLGAAIGVTGTLLSQRLLARDTARKDLIVRAAERQQRCLPAVEAFLAIYQEMERIANDHGGRTSETSHRMWLLHNQLDLIATDQLKEPLADLANKLNKVWWNGTPNGEPAYKYLHGSLTRFRTAAKAEVAALELERRR